MTTHDGVSAPDALDLDAIEAQADAVSRRACAACGGSGSAGIDDCSRCDGEGVRTVPLADVRALVAEIRRLRGAAASLACPSCGHPNAHDPFCAHIRGAT